MKFRAVMLAATLVMMACSSLDPVPIQVGDRCFRCREIIRDRQMAAELIDPAGMAFKFEGVACMTKFMKENPGEFAAIFVTDHSNGRMIKASGATFVPIVVVDGYKTTTNYKAFGAAEVAREAAQREKTEAIDWKAVLAAAE